MIETAPAAPIALLAQACERCRFMHKTKSDLECRRMPPTAFCIPGQNAVGQLVPKMLTAFPAVRPDQSCGEFKPRFDIPG